MCKHDNDRVFLARFKSSLFRDLTVLEKHVLNALLKENGDKYVFVLDLAHVDLRCRNCESFQIKFEAEEEDLKMLKIVQE